MKHRWTSWCLIITLAAAAFAGSALAQDPDDGETSEFDKLVNKVIAGSDVPEAEVRKMLAQAKRVGKPFAANQAVKKHLRTNLKPSAGLLLDGAEIAELAGDLRVAVARYKSYLKLAGTDQQASEAAANMYNLQINFLYSRTEAYQFWKENADKYRRSVNARKYDHFFINMAIQAQDYETAAAAISRGINQGPQLEKSFYHGHIVSLADDLLRLRRNGDTKLKNHEQLKAVMGYLPKDWRRNYAQLAHAYLAFRQKLQTGQLKGKEAPAFAAVLKQAKGWYDADPRLVTAYKVFIVFATPDRDHTEWRRMESEKRKFFQHVWDKSDANAREWLMTRNRLMDVNWILAGYWNKNLYDHDFLLSRFDHKSAVKHLKGKSLAEIQKIAAKNKGHWLGIIANAFAANPDPIKAFDKLMAMYGANHDTGFWHRLLFESGWYEAHVDKHKQQNDKYKLVRHYWMKYYSQSAAPAVDRTRTRDLVEYLRGKNKLNTAETSVLLSAVNWVPYSRKEREDVFMRSYKEFGRWRNQSTKQLNQLKRKKKRNAREQKEFAALQKAVADIPKMESLFKNLLDENSYKKNRGPNAVAQKSQAFLAAWRGGRKAEAVAAGKQLHAVVAGKERPFQRQTVSWITSYKDWGLRLDVLQKELKQMNANGNYSGVAGALDGISDRNNRPWPDQIPRDQQATAKKVHTAISAAFIKELDKGRYRGQLLDWIRRLQRGHGWRESNWGSAAMEKVIQGNWLTKANHRPVRGDYPVSLNYMHLIRHEFTGLQGKYPYTSYFDPFFVEESKKLGFLHAGYREYGRDGKGTIAGYVTGLWKDGKDPFIERHGEWRNLLLDGGGKGIMRKYYEDEFKAGRKISRVALGWDDLDLGDLNDSRLQQKRPKYFAAFKAYVANSPRFAYPLGGPSFASLERIDAAKLTDAELDILLPAFSSHMSYSGWRGYVPIVWVMHRGLTARNREQDIFRVIPYMWKIMNETRDHHWRRIGYERMNEHIKKLIEEQKFELAAAYSLAGRTIGGKFDDALSLTLESARTKAVSQIGTIPVPASDRRYKLFVAQLSFAAGNTVSAWKTYLEWAGKNTGFSQQNFKDLDLRFLTWLVEKHTETGGEGIAKADLMARSLIQWVDSQPNFHDQEARGQLYLAFANIAFKKQEYPIARAKYESIRIQPDFRNTQAALDAELRIAEVDRLTRNFDAALERLEKLARKTDPRLRVAALYQLALVKNDQEDFEGAFEQLKAVLALKPDHAEAKVLRGKLYNKTRQYHRATALKLGHNMAQEVIVPGKPLRVSLKDDNLAIVSSSANVQIRAWTEPGGDQELFTLYPLADSKTQFDGKLDTALDVPKKGDGVLQLLGDDKVFYDYTVAFKKKNHIPEEDPMSLKVRTPAELEASARKILTPEEKKDQLLLEEIKRKRGIHGGRRGIRRGRYRIEMRTERNAKEVKPGNPINVQVRDGDHSITAGVDELHVTAHTSSGDVIEKGILRESGKTSGVFDGKIKTGKAQPVAYASDSVETRNPNFVISPKQDYQPWQGLPASKNRWFSVDLNDNVPLKQLALTGVDGRRIKDFVVQTSFDNEHFTNVAAWPRKLKVWDGKLTLEIAGVGDLPKDVSAQQYLDWRHLYSNKVHKRYRVPDFAVNFNEGTFRSGFLKSTGLRRGQKFVARLRGALYSHMRQVRIFTIKKGAEGDSVSYDLYIDGVNPFGDRRDRGRRGRRGRQEQDNEQNQFKLVLDKGVHTFELVMRGNVSTPMQYDLLVNTAKPPYIARIPRDMFDHERHADLAREFQRKPTVVAPSGDKKDFTITFPEDTNARVVRLLLLGHEGDAPAIKKITLKNRDDKMILPTKADFRDLRQNDTLEIIAGDRITIRYRDPKILDAERPEEVHEDFLQVTYNNAEMEATFVDYITEQDMQVPVYIPMVRFKRDEPLMIFINDPDADTSAEKDRLKFSARVTGKKSVELEALETQPDSGIFLAKIFPMTTPEPDRETHLKVEEDDNIIVRYMDKENTDPGIPWMRTIKVNQVFWQDPELRCFSVQSAKLTEEMRRLYRARKPRDQAEDDEDDADEPDKALVLTRPDRPQYEETATSYMTSPVVTEIVWPTAVLSAKSTISVYAQTSTGLKKAGKEFKPGSFDVNVPGTIKLTATPTTELRHPTPPGFATVVRQGAVAGDALEDGVFTFSIPTRLGDCPNETLINEDVPVEDEYLREERRRAKQAGEEAVKPEYALLVSGNDEIYVGFNYKDWEGKEHWLVQRVKMTTSPLFHIMDKKYEEQVDGLYVGDTLYMKIIDPMMDKTEQRDTIKIDIKTDRGRQVALELRETFEHTGEFHGFIQPVYAAEGKQLQEGELGVVYGDTMTLTYKSSMEEIVKTLEVHKGADGDLIAFTKRFKDKDIAVQTQFTIAEAYFELAKKHRALGKKDLARREIKQGKRLLEEAIRDFPDTETKAQADYLLANLALEFANDAVDDRIKNKFYLEAINRFGDIVATNAKSPYAPKAQFKKALTYEKMGRLDKACEEYVKLSYRYPNNELVAETIARLGQYFWRKGNSYKKVSANPELDELEAFKFKKKAGNMYKTSGEVFGRLAKRFPNHKLAGKTTVLAGQAFIKAEHFPKAIEVLTEAVETYKDDRKLTPEASYWLGDCHYKTKDMVMAYRTWKTLTWDYPESKWAKYARGRLAQPDMVKVEESQMSDGG